MQQKEENKIAEEENFFSHFGGKEGIYAQKYGFGI